MLRWPGLRGWGFCLLIGGLVATTVAGVGFASGILKWEPASGNLPLLFLSVLVVPAFTEELFFRGLLVPERGETQRPVLIIAVGLAVFVLWHVVEAKLFLPGATLFLEPAFLLCAGLIGLGCALMRYLTGSLWPAVLFHAVLVWAWKAYLGGPSLAELMG
ncbi:CPBP family glutamic-type intramembrane protease [Asticcacaulis sp. BYS171W]|uniref:CPBP family glutamic-type intramembrane protease n=1 Tax=Asticcacaulis aquaticus TaxID=2984212 RepID=A0ABT5HQW4_9CAUL|nr:CPBP family glutamic-type intramembrane protease [Asticcacaulis aquaticus]MDC7682467.1 CPBP family glutamic-type intramembrane protease [Asticcacaulis aquaticus]